MGVIFANRIVAGTILYSQVKGTRYQAATDAALLQKVEDGAITEDQLAALMEM